MTRAAASAPAEQSEQADSGSRREATKERNREAILAAGLEVFAERGYGEATIRDLIRASGLSTGTFYNYFPDKEAVLRALVDRSATELRAILHERRIAATGPEDFVVGGFRAFFEYMTSDPTFFTLLSRNAGAVRQMLDEPILGSVIGELASDLQDAVERGDLPAFDVELMSAAMAGAGLELAVTMLERNSVDAERASEFAGRLFLGGIERLARSSG